MSNQAIEQFVINTTLIDPLNDILSKLKSDKFQDKDINWLNSKLKNYTKLALETIGVKLIMSELKYEIMNEFVKNKFVDYFETLLKYFKSF